MRLSSLLDVMRGYDYGLVTILRDLDQMIPNAATEKALLILRISVIYIL